MLWLQLKDTPSLGDQHENWSDADEEEVTILTQRIDSVSITKTQLGRQREQARMAALAADDE